MSCQQNWKTEMLDSSGNMVSLLGWLFIGRLIVYTLRNTLSVCTTFMNTCRLQYACLTLSKAQQDCDDIFTSLCNAYGLTYLERAFWKLYSPVSENTHCLQPFIRPASAHQTFICLLLIGTLSTTKHQASFCTPDLHLLAAHRNISTTKQQASFSTPDLHLLAAHRNTVYNQTSGQLQHTRPSFACCS